MSNNKKSSVMWLHEQLINSGLDYPINQIGKILEQAKEMHEEEIIEAYENGHNDGCRYMDSLKQDFEDGNEYYNETYGGKNE